MKNHRQRRNFRSEHLLSVSIFAFLLLIPCSGFIIQRQPPRTTANTKSVSSTPPGYYFEISPCPRCYRCRPCPLDAGWQAKMMRLLGASGISSFPGEASGFEKANEEFGVVASIKRFAKPVNYDSKIYVGPFETEQSAITAISDLCAALDEVGLLESSCDEMIAKREGSTFYTRGSFDVSGVRLLPK